MSFKKLKDLPLGFIFAIAILTFSASSPSAIAAETLCKKTTASRYCYRKGDRGDRIYYLIEILRELGYYEVGNDSHFGPVTEGAVRQFQIHHGLGNDGIVGPGTIRKLCQEQDSRSTQSCLEYLTGLSQSSTTTSSSGSGNYTQCRRNAGSAYCYREGDRGDRIYQIIEMFRELGYYTVGNDGYFGPVLKDCVLRFQRDYGLTADGIIGYGTIRQLCNTQRGISSQICQQNLTGGSIGISGSTSLENLPDGDYEYSNEPVSKALIFRKEGSVARGIYFPYPDEISICFHGEVRGNNIATSFTITDIIRREPTYSTKQIHIGIEDMFQRPFVHEHRFERFLSCLQRLEAER